MKELVIHRAYGLFHVPAELQTVFNCSRYPQEEVDLREDPRFIDWVLNSPNASGFDVAYIPNEATDYEILEYDGAERIIMCVDGKLTYADTHKMRLWREQHDV